MNGDTLATVAIALACVLAVSVTASAVQSAVSETPDEAIDVDPESLPVSDREAVNLERKVQDEELPSAVEPDSEDVPEIEADRAETPTVPPGVGEGDGAGLGGTDGTVSVAGGEGPEGSVLGAWDGADGQAPAAREVPVSGDAEGAKAAGPGGPGSRDGGAGGALDGVDGEDGASAGSDGDGDGSPEGPIAAFGLVLALLVLATIAALLVRHRERFRGGPDDGGARTAAPDGGAADPMPQHGVAEAWGELLAAIDRSHDPTASPADCAREAVEAGFDPDGVRTVRVVYEEVRYGGAPVTPRRERAAWEGLERSRRGHRT